MGQAMTLRSLVDQQGLRDMQMKQLERQFATEDALKSAGVIGADGNLDEAATFKNLAGVVGVPKAQEWRNKFTTDKLAQDKSRYESQKAELDALKTRWEISAQAFGAIMQNPTLENIQAVRQQLANNGIEFRDEDMPQSPEQITSFLQRQIAMGMSVKANIEARERELDRLKPLSEPGRIEWDMRNRAKWNNIAAGVLPPVGVPPPVGGAVKPLAPDSPVGVSIEAQGNSVPQAAKFDPMQYAYWRSIKGNPPEGFEWGPDGKPMAMPEVQAYQLSRSKAAGTTVNVDTGLQLSKTAQSKIDENVLDSTARLARVSEIERRFKPKYQVLGNRIANSWTSLKSRMGVGLDPKEAAELTEFQQFRRVSTEDLNRLIKELTGSAMGVQEAERIMSTVPQAGQNFWDGDDPVTFKAKLDATLQSVKMAVARAVYIKRNQASLFSADGTPTIPLERMPQLMNERGAQIASEARQKYPNMNPKDINKFVLKQLGQEFGIATD
jgi:hypothetical protein